MKKFLILLCVFASMSFVVKASGLNDSIAVPLAEHTRNIVYPDLQFWLLGGSVNLNYERMLSTRKSGYFSLKGTYGQWLFWDSGGDLFKATGNWLWGKGNSQIEVGFGGMLLIHVDQYAETGRKWESVNVLPDIYWGYRYKKPKGHFILKAGIGFPGIVTLGIGTAF